MADGIAAFLDRDGTLIEDRHYLADSDQVRLLPGVIDATRALVDAGVRLIVVTNQSGIAQGLVTKAQYDATRDRLADLMSAGGVPLDLQLHCPHHPDVTGPCRCRKPGPELYERAAARFDLDLTRSLYVGDRWRDVAPGLAFGGMAWLVPSPQTPATDRLTADAHGIVAPSLADAVSRFLARG